MNIFDKLDKILEQPGWTQVRVSEKIGVAQSSVNRWRQRQSEPRGHYRDAISDIYQSMFGPDQAGSLGLREVPLVSWVSAGALSKDDVAQEAIGTILIADLPPGDWLALEVQGSSMDRISPPGSRIFVNRQDKQLVANACYVIDDGEGNATYKRFRPNPTRFEPVSTEPSHETIFPDNDPIIVGRVGLSQIRM